MFGDAAPVHAARLDYARFAAPVLYITAQLDSFFSLSLSLFPFPALRVCKKDSVAEADAQVALSFARARHQDLSRELHYANALFYNALTQHG